MSMVYVVMTIELRECHFYHYNSVEDCSPLKVVFKLLGLYEMSMGKGCEPLGFIDRVWERCQT